MFDDDDLVELIPNLTLFAHKLTGDNADDLVQATLEKALNKRHQFIPGTTLIYWLNTIMQTTFFDMLRSKKRKNEVSDLPDDAIYGPHQEDDVALHRAIAKLQTMPRDQALGVAMMASGYSYVEVAEAIQKPANQITKMVLRAREKLAKEDETLPSTITHVSSKLSGSERQARYRIKHREKHLAGIRRCKLANRLSKGE